MQTKNCDVSSAATAEFQLAYACVYLQKPFPDCYCMNLSSLNIPKVLAFCNRAYRSCPIYCQRTAENPIAACDKQP
jgi:hypothetical protein